jgi:hypothetical protein
MICCRFPQAILSSVYILNHKLQIVWYSVQQSVFRPFPIVANVGVGYLHVDVKVYPGKATTGIDNDTAVKKADMGMAKASSQTHILYKMDPR